MGGGGVLGGRGAERRMDVEGDLGFGPEWAASSASSDCSRFRRGSGFTLRGCAKSRGDGEILGEVGDESLEFITDND